MRGIPGPLAMATLALTWWIGHESPLLYHLFNLAVHLVNGVLVFLLCRYFAGSGARAPVAMAGGLLFLLHPLAIQTVNQAAHRGNLLGLFFVLLSIVMFLRAVGDNQKLREGALVASPISFILALGCHEAAWILPVLILAVDRALHRDDLKGRIGVHLLFWAISPAYLVTLYAAGAADAGLASNWGGANGATAPAIPIHPLSRGVERLSYRKR